MRPEISKKIAGNDVMSIARPSHRVNFAVNEFIFYIADFLAFEIFLDADFRLKFC